MHIALRQGEAGGFTGVYLALYAQSNPDGGAAGGYADFDWFNYPGREENVR